MFARTTNIVRRTINIVRRTRFGCGEFGILLKSSVLGWSFYQLSTTEKLEAMTAASGSCRGGGEDAAEAKMLPRRQLLTSVAEVKRGSS